MSAESDRAELERKVDEVVDELRAALASVDVAVGELEPAMQRLVANLRAAIAAYDGEAD